MGHPLFVVAIFIFLAFALFSYGSALYIQGVPGGICELWEGVPYVKIYRYNPKHVCPK
jgi:hypothetical protein